MKRRGLGRGLDVLLGVASGEREQSEGQPPKAPMTGEMATEVVAVVETLPTGPQLRQISVDRIQRGRYQPRVDLHQDTLEELAASIRVQGVVQPVVVRPLGDGSRYELIAGERRWRASQMAGLPEIPAVVRDVPDSAALAISLIENIQRENLNPLEEATALQRLVNEFSLTHEEAAQAVGRSRAAVSNLLRLLSLQPEVRTMVENGDMEMGHARSLLALEDRERQIEAARTVAGQELTVRETEELVRNLLADAPPPPKEKPASERSRSVDPNIRRLQDDLAERLGAQVVFHHGVRGKGRLVIQYNSLDELDGILAHIK
ncbi:putative chromosome-partitioning protein ParB [Gammaproteobacteria bacterium]